jgi:hypothetical protein
MVGGTVSFGPVLNQSSQSWFDLAGFLPVDARKQIDRLRTDLGPVQKQSRLSASAFLLA